MAYSLLFSERPVAAARPINPFQAFFAWVAAARQKRARRVALASLLELDAPLLNDLGIDRHDVIDAMQHPSEEAGRALAERRARASTEWRSHP